MSVDDRPCLIHIGMPRCGSTSLQFNAFMHLPDTVYIGKPMHHGSEAMRLLLLSLLRLERWEWENRRERIEREYLRPLLQRAGLRLLVSEEELATSGFDVRVDRWELARRLQAWFPQAHVLLIIREQVRLLESIYCHLHQIAGGRYIHGRRFEVWIDELIARPATFLHLLRFEEAHRLWSHHFGADRVHVRCFEDFAAGPGDFVGGLAPLLGMDAAALKAAYVDIHRNARSPRIDTSIREDQREALRRMFSAGNAILSRAHHLDLERHGYAVQAEGVQ